MNQIKNYTLPVLVLLSGIFLSTISAYYSILGLISIFSGSALLITLMGVGLETAKITSCLWLHKHWNDKIGFLKLYLSISVIILMAITSLGVYGFLTKANLKQSEGVNLNLAKVSALESNIQREQSKLDLNSQQISQYNNLLSKLITEDVRRASNERKRIQSEIKVLSKESKEIAKTIDNLNTELLPFKSEINAVEVEVGTLLYISKLIYGNDYKEHLPQTLTVLTLLIIFVFDPLAIGLLIASQKSFRLISQEDRSSPKNGGLTVSAEHKSSEGSSSWGEFEMPDGGSSKDIKERVDELKTQVAEDVKIFNKARSNENLFNQRSHVVTSNENIQEKLNSDGLLSSGYKSYIDEQFNKYWNENAEIYKNEYDTNISYENPLIKEPNYSNDIDREELQDALNSIYNKQESLPDEFQKVLDDNIWDLYENTELLKDEVVDDEGLENDVKVSGRMPKRHRQNSKK